MSARYIAKAVALGASAVLLGRAPLYGVAAGGQAGADDILGILRQELEITLRRPSMRDVARDCLRKGSLVKLSLDGVPSGLSGP
jgi:isopentenyl diphosphate isomerase/L-lactate dehydrogenase-like FMN-dependent dehydrogenase